MVRNRTRQIVGNGTRKAIEGTYSCGLCFCPVKKLKMDLGADGLVSLLNILILRSFVKQAG